MFAGIVVIVQDHVLQIIDPRAILNQVKAAKMIADLWHFLKRLP